MDNPNANSHTRVEKCGYLQKQTARSFPYLQSWKKKYFVLSKGRLYFYERADSSGGDKGAGVIDLKYFDHVVASRDKRVTNVFEITSQDRSFFDPGRHLLAAESASEMKDWINKIKGSMELIRNNNRPTKSSTKAVRTMSDKTGVKSEFEYKGKEKLSSNDSCAEKQDGNGMGRSEKAKSVPGSKESDRKELSGVQRLQKLGALPETCVQGMKGMSSGQHDEARVKKSVSKQDDRKSVQEAKEEKKMRDSYRNGHINSPEKLDKDKRSPNIGNKLIKFKKETPGQSLSTAKNVNQGGAEPGHIKAGKSASNVSTEEKRGKRTLSESCEDQLNPSFLPPSIEITDAGEAKVASKIQQLKDQIVFQMGDQKKHQTKLKSSDSTRSTNSTDSNNAADPKEERTKLKPRRRSSGPKVAPNPVVIFGGQDDKSALSKEEGATQLESITKHRVKGPAGRRPTTKNRRHALLVKQRASSMSALQQPGSSEDISAARTEQSWNTSMDVLEENTNRFSFIMNTSHPTLYRCSSEDEGLSENQTKVNVSAGKITAISDAEIQFHSLPPEISSESKGSDFKSFYTYMSEKYPSKNTLDNVNKLAPNNCGSANVGNSLFVTAKVDDLSTGKKDSSSNTSCKPDNLDFDANGDKLTLGKEGPFSIFSSMKNNAPFLPSSREDCSTGLSSVNEETFKFTGLTDKAPFSLSVGGIFNSQVSFGGKDAQPGFPKAIPQLGWLKEGPSSLLAEIGSKQTGDFRSLPRSLLKSTKSQDSLNPFLNSSGQNSSLQFKDKLSFERGMDFGMRDRIMDVSAQRREVSVVGDNRFEVIPPLSDSKPEEANKSTRGSEARTDISVLEQKDPTSSDIHNFTKKINSLSTTVDNLQFHTRELERKLGDFRSDAVNSGLVLKTDAGQLRMAMDSLKTDTNAMKEKISFVSQDVNRAWSELKTQKEEAEKIHNLAKESLKAAEKTKAEYETSKRDYESLIKELHSLVSSIRASLVMKDDDEGDHHRRRDEKKKESDNKATEETKRGTEVKKSSSAKEVSTSNKGGYQSFFQRPASLIYGFTSKSSGKSVSFAEKSDEKGSVDERQTQGTPDKKQNNDHNKQKMENLSQKSGSELENSQYPHKESPLIKRNLENERSSDIQEDRKNIAGNLKPVEEKKNTGGLANIQNIESSKKGNTQEKQVFVGSESLKKISNIDANDYETTSALGEKSLKTSEVKEEKVKKRVSLNLGSSQSNTGQPLSVQKNEEHIPMMDESLNELHAPKLRPSSGISKVSINMPPQPFPFGMEKSMSSPSVADKVAGLRNEPRSNGNFFNSRTDDLKISNTASAKGHNEGYLLGSLGNRTDVVGHNQDFRHTSDSSLSQYKNNLSVSTSIFRQSSMSSVPENAELKHEQRPGHFAISRQHSSPNLPIQRQSSATSNFPIQRQNSLGTVPEDATLGLTRQASLLSVPEDRPIVDQTLPLSPSPSMTFFSLSPSPSGTKLDCVRSSRTDSGTFSFRNSMELVTGPVLTGSPAQDSVMQSLPPLSEFRFRGEGGPISTSSFKKSKEKRKLTDEVAV